MLKSQEIRVWMNLYILDIKGIYPLYEFLNDQALFCVMS